MSLSSVEQSQLRIPETPAKESGVLADYYEFLTQGNIKVQTAYNYYLAVRTLAKFLKCVRGNMDCDHTELIMHHVSREEMEALSAEEWQQYIALYRYGSHRESNNSFLFRLTATRRFYRWLAPNNAELSRLMAETERPKQVASSAVAVSTKRVQLLMEALDGEHLKRNACIVLLFLYGGLSIEEVRNLELEDLGLECLCIRGENESRYIELPPALAKLLDEYMEVRLPPRKDGNPLFVSSAYGRLCPRAIDKMFRKAAERAGVDIKIQDLQATAKLRAVEQCGFDTAMKTASNPAYFRDRYRTAINKNQHSGTATA